MAMTITEKILAVHADEKKVTPGQIVVVDVDRVFTHDVFGPLVIKAFYKKGLKKVWDKEKIVFIGDHEVPTISEQAGAQYQEIVAFAKEQDLKNFYYGQGICHQIMPEQGYVRPGQIILGTDSHTVTYGALGCFSTGIGTQEMANIWATGKIWLKVPPTIKFECIGKWPAGVYSKDLILHVIGLMRADGCTYKATEFTGPAILDLSVDARLTISNMVVEMGAKNGIMPVDHKVKEYLAQRNIPESAYTVFQSDADAAYEQVITIDVSKLTPTVAAPKGVDDVMPLEKVEGTKIHQGFIGSCTNGRIEDLRQAAQILKDKKIAPYMKLVVSPASKDIYKQALQEGLIEIFLDAGAIVTNAYCGLCYGKTGGVLGKGEVAICSNNRNFAGRLGHKESQVYLASPATVAASVVAGKITDPRSV